MKKLAWLVLAFCSLLLVACSSGQNQSGKLKVMTTFYPVYELLSKSLETREMVELLIGSGSEPHDFELSAKGRAKSKSQMSLSMRTRTWKRGCLSC